MPTPRPQLAGRRLRDAHPRLTASIGLAGAFMATAYLAWRLLLTGRGINPVLFWTLLTAEIYGIVSFFELVHTTWRLAPTGRPPVGQALTAACSSAPTTSRPKSSVPPCCARSTSSPEWSGSEIGHVPGAYPGERPNSPGVAPTRHRPPSGPSLRRGGTTRAAGPSPEPKESAVDLDGRHRVQSLVGRPAVYVHPDDTLRRLAATLIEEAIGAALVRGPHHAIGLVSERDIVAALAEGADPDRTRVSDVMSEDLLVASPGDDLLEAVHRMLDAEVRHLPVVENDVHYGMISVRDALRALADEVENGPEASEG